MSPSSPSESVPDESSSRISRRRPESRGRTRPRLRGGPGWERTGLELATEDRALEDGGERTAIPETQPESELTDNQQYHHQSPHRDRRVTKACQWVVELTKTPEALFIPICKSETVVSVSPRYYHSTQGTVTLITDTTGDNAFSYGRYPNSEP